MENWSAFAPDFKELDENVDYEERESEFDIEDEDRSPARDNPEEDCEDEEVDVVGAAPGANFLSSDEDEKEEENTLIYLPVSLEIDDSDNLDVVENGPANTSDTDSPSKSKTVEIDLKNAPKDGKSNILKKKKLKF